MNNKMCALWRCVPFATLALGLSAGVCAQSADQQANSGAAGSSSPDKLPS